MDSMQVNLPGYDVINLTDDLRIRTVVSDVKELSFLARSRKAPIRQTQQYRALAFAYRVGALVSDAEDLDYTRYQAVPTRTSIVQRLGTLT